MPGLRTIVAALIALAIAMAPIGAATARLHVTDAADLVKISSEALAVKNDNGSAPEDMSDCARLMRDQGKTKSPCCDSGAVCPADLCPLKFSKLFATLPTPIASGRLTLTVLRPTTIVRPPGWSDRPTPPPPRA